MHRIMCEWCGEIIIGTGKRRFCSRHCSASWAGNNQSKETKDKRSNTMKGRKKSEETRRRMSESKKGVSISEETKEKLRESYSKNKTRIISDYQKIADETYEYVCCGCGKSEGKLSVHHIDGDHDNNNPDNLVWLCFSCHGKVHSKDLVYNMRLNKEFTEKILETRKLNLK